MSFRIGPHWSQMQVRVNKSGDYATPFQIDLSRLWPGHAANAFSGTYRQNSPVTDSHCLGQSESLIYRDDRTVVEDDISEGQDLLRKIRGLRLLATALAKEKKAINTSCKGLIGPFISTSRGCMTRGYYQNILRQS